MKLIGSLTEQEFRKELIRANLFIADSGEKIRLLKVLRGLFPLITSAYILDWIPEQGEDIYKILIDGQMVAKVELARSSNNEILLESISVAEYIRGLSKQGQIQLAVALDLVKINR